LQVPTRMAFATLFSHQNHLSRGRSLCLARPPLQRRLQHLLLHRPPQIRCSHQWPKRQWCSYWTSRGPWDAEATPRDITVSFQSWRRNLRSKSTVWRISNGFPLWHFLNKLGLARTPCRESTQRILQLRRLMWMVWKQYPAHTTKKLWRQLTIWGHQQELSWMQFISSVMGIRTTVQLQDMTIASRLTTPKIRVWRFAPFFCMTVGKLRNTWNLWQGSQVEIIMSLSSDPDDCHRLCIDLISSSKFHVHTCTSRVSELLWWFTSLSINFEEVQRQTLSCGKSPGHSNKQKGTY